MQAVRVSCSEKRRIQAAGEWAAVCLPAVLTVLAVVIGGCPRSGPAPGPRETLVWAADDSERIARWDGLPALARGEDNAAWSPGQPVRLLALPGETVAFQVVVTGGQGPLSGVTVDLLALRGAATLCPLQRICSDCPK